MNRNQRRYKYKRPKSSEGKKKSNEIEEVYATRARHQMQSRCCYITPDQSSFAQLTNNSLPSQYQNEVAGEPHKSGVLNPITEPGRSTQLEVITIAKPKRPVQPNIIPIAKPKRPVLPDMLTIPRPKRSFQRTLPDVNRRVWPHRTRLPDIHRKAPCTVTQADDSIATDPYMSTGDLNMATDPYVSTGELYMATEPYVSTADVTPTNVDTTTSTWIDEQCRPKLPELTIAQLQELRKVLFPPCPKIEKASQYASPSGVSKKYEGIMRYQNADEINRVILRGRDEETITQYHNLPKNVYIAEIPRIKLMAVKFTKYKKDNIELRRLDEKVVCVEYDVFEKEVDQATPVQRMRTFFSIKPIVEGKEAKELTELPPTIKSKFNISITDLQKLSQKEIEIIDGKIIENQPYLDDLRKLLRRKENTHKAKNTLNLQALYDMGKKDLLDFDTNFERNTMPKEELDEMQNLILQNCDSSVHGIRRRTVKNNSNIFEDIAQTTAHKMSQSLVTELLRESNKNIDDL